MYSPFTPLVATVHRGIPFTASDGQAFVRLPVRSRAHLFSPALGCTGDEMRWALAPPPPIGPRTAPPLSRQRYQIEIKTLTRKPPNHPAP